MGKTIHGEKYAEIKKLWAQGWTQKAIGKELSMSRSQVGRVLKTTVRNPLPVYSELHELEGNYIIVGDVQLPTTDWEFASYVPLVAKNFGIRKLVIAGDFLNVDSFSRYPITERLPAIMDEFAAAKELLDSWDDAFDEIEYIPGNHEKRFMRWSNGHLGMEVLGRLLDNDKLRVYSSTRIVVVSGGVSWRVTHQNGYSVHTGNVGGQLAHKFQTNVITHHEHSVGIMRDKWNHYTVVSNGGLHDEKTMHYVQEYDNTRKTMSQSFVMLDNGVAHLLTPYSSMTDWSVYL